MARLPANYDRRLFYFELMGGTHQDDGGTYATGDLVISKYDLAGRYGKDKFKPIPFPVRTGDSLNLDDPDSDLSAPVQGSDDDGLTRLSLRELRELATEGQIELAVAADKAQIIEAIRRAWDDA